MSGINITTLRYVFWMFFDRARMRVVFTSECSLIVFEIAVCLFLQKCRWRDDYLHGISLPLIQTNLILLRVLRLAMFEMLTHNFFFLFFYSIACYRFNVVSIKSCKIKCIFEYNLFSLRLQSCRSIINTSINRIIYAIYFLFDFVWKCWT